jgi:hypothetical protein
MTELRSREAQISQREAAARRWAVDGGGLTAARTKGTEDSLKRLLVDAYEATASIYAGAPVHPTPPDLVARAETAVATFEGACAALGYRRSF